MGVVYVLRKKTVAKSIGFTALASNYKVHTHPFLIE